MNNNPLMAMYEAQAIAIEKQMEIDRLQLEKNELAEELKRIKLEKDDKHQVSADNDGDPDELNSLQQQLGNLLELKIAALEINKRALEEKNRFMEELNSTSDDQRSTGE